MAHKASNAIRAAQILGCLNLSDAAFMMNPVHPTGVTSRANTA